jgi:hypothetical protein
MRQKNKLLSWRVDLPCMCRALPRGRWEGYAQSKWAAEQVAWRTLHGGSNGCGGNSHGGGSASALASADDRPPEEQADSFSRSELVIHRFSSLAGDQDLASTLAASLAVGGVFPDGLVRDGVEWASPRSVARGIVSSVMGSLFPMRDGGTSEVDDVSSDDFSSGVSRGVSSGGVEVGPTPHPAEAPVEAPATDERAVPRSNSSGSTSSSNHSNSRTSSNTTNRSLSTGNSINPSKVVHHGLRIALEDVVAACGSLGFALTVGRTDAPSAPFPTAVAAAAWRARVEHFAAWEGLVSDECAARVRGLAAAPTGLEGAIGLCERPLVGRLETKETDGEAAKHCAECALGLLKK